MRTYAYFALAAIAGGFSGHSVAMERIDKTPVVTIAAPPPPVMTEVFAPPPPGERPNPIPSGNPGNWAGTMDYPVRALAEQREGTTKFRLDVDASGKVTACQITGSSGHADLDEATCKNITRRGRFYPAQDKKGNAIAGNWGSSVRWVIPETVSMVMPTQANLSFPRSPQLLKPWSLKIAKEDYPATALANGEQGIARFIVDIDQTGKAIGCTITTSSGFASLDSKSCDLARSWEYEPARNLQGEPAFGKSANGINWRLPKGSPAVANTLAKPRINPFADEGTVKLTLDFDKSGKLTNCVTETKGLTGLFTPNMPSPNKLCETPPPMDLKPFTDAEGNSVPRRVILKISVEHGDIAETPVSEPAPKE
ncbi:MAG: TonB family protein [Sphingomonadales bacterium]|nr:TonB family protein [Sphingomonadales bacterium]